ncbi:MAG TPA: cbb3-type cytochrome c oxidase subunit I [Candidatus Dormibacteraeota bacterium]|nr:cbb3-type cytochrome c oxidase subunit I [Candidatus Dormibacteraeota bacterium]
MIPLGFRIASEVAPVLGRKPLLVSRPMVTSFLAIVFLSMAVWAHHLLTVGMSIVLETFFMAMSVLVAIPTDVEFFKGIATARGDRSVSGCP